jgi:TP901-1 family phage major tail protein
MGRINGADILLYVDESDSATPQWSPVAHQRGVTFGLSNNLIDISSKDSGRAEEFLMGRMSQSITLDHLYVTDDTAYQSIKDASRNGTNITLRRYQKNGSFSPVEEATAVIESIDEDFPDQEAGSVAASFRISGTWATVSP